MLNLKESFALGYQIAYTGSYFNSIELLGHYTNFPNPELISRVSKELKTLKTVLPRTMAEINHIHNVAEKEQIILLPPPKFPEAFFSWAKIAHEGFSEHLGTAGDQASSTPESIAFEVAYRAGEMMASIKVLTVVLNLSTSVIGVPAFEGQWKFLKKEIMGSLKKMGPAAKMAILLPKGPDILHDTLYVEMMEKAEELGNADIDFSNEAYLHLLSSKATNYIDELNKKINWLIKHFEE